MLIHFKVKKKKEKEKYAVTLLRDQRRISFIILIEIERFNLVESIRFASYTFRTNIDSNICNNWRGNKQRNVAVKIDPSLFADYARISKLSNQTVLPNLINIIDQVAKETQRSFSRSISVAIKSKIK